MVSLPTIAFAVLAGFIPPLLWLWFWLREDRLHPEPKRLLFLTFFAGMVAVPLVLFLEHKACDYLSPGGSCSIVAVGMVSASSVLPLIIAWAAIEEILKFAAASFAVLWRRQVDEPIDALMYMITVALGFAAIENTFFIMNAAGDGALAAGFKASGLRFLGATLLHTLCSAMIGISIALAFYKKNRLKIEYLLTGILAAITLHTLFNFLIIQSEGERTLMVFASVWIGSIVLILIFEKIKRIRTPFFNSRRS